MSLTQNKIFLAVLTGIIVFSLLIYATEYMKETTTPETTTTAASSTSSTSTTASSSTTSTPTTTTSSSTTSTTTSSTTTSTTTTTLNYYWSKYAGKGYRQLFIDVKFTCPSCVPPTARALSLHQGMVMQNIGFRQNVTWVIYDPNRTTQDNIMRVVRSEGDASVLNDIPIP